MARYIQMYTVKTTTGAPLAVNASTNLSIPLQSGYPFIWRRLTAQFDQSDWFVQINITGVNRNIMDTPILGALLFGNATTAATPNVWHHGMPLPIDMTIGGQGVITFAITNGLTGPLNVAFGLLGYTEGQG